MEWSKLIGLNIEVDGIKMQVYDYCKTCRRIWASDDHKNYMVKVGRHDTFKVTSERLKALE